MKKWSWKISAQKMLIGSAEEKLLSPHSLLGNDGAKSWKLWQYSNSCESNENKQQVKEVQAVWLCLLQGRQIEETFKNTQWGKVKQMQPMRLCIF